jgi:hypothetical protein
MKKITTLMLAASVAMTVSSGFAQGTITFQNNGTELLTIPGGASAPVTGTSGIDVELFYQKNTGQAAPAAITASSLGSWEGIATLATIGPIAGRFSQSVVTGTDVAPAGNVWLEAVAFNGNQTSLQNALSSPNTTLVGFGNVFSQGTGDGGSVGAVSTALNGLTGFSVAALAPVPEPSTIVLGGLGAAALLAFRRRK